MTDEQGLHDALESLVPEPPPTREWGAESRGLARRTRVRRIGVVVASVVVAALAVPVVRSLATDPTPPVVSDTVHGTGPTACHQRDHRDRLGQSVDTRVVDGATAATWLREAGDSSTASQMADARTVTVCVMDQALSWSVAVARPGHSVVVVQHGDYPGVVDVMTKLDTLAKGGAATTDAPFRCPTPGSAPARTVANYLPSGATGALLCYDTPYLYSPRKILDSTEVDALLLTVDRAPITYVAPNVDCSGNGMPTYSLVLRYPTGTRTVSMEECRGLALGPYTRNAPTDLDRTFEQALLSRGTAAQNPPTCPLSRLTPPLATGDLRHVVAARYCSSGSRGHALTPAQLSRLQRWGSSLEPATTQPEGRCEPLPGGWPQLALTDAWGNTFMVTIECRGRRYLAIRMPDGSDQVTYPLGDQQIVEGLLRQLAAG